jgi:multiple sugar transport system ATP-binding protein
MTTIQIESLRKEYDVSGGVEVAVNGVDLEVEEEFLTLVGPSGCGKTTTLRCIAGLEHPTSGSIQFDEEDLTEVPPNKRNLAMMFQNIALYPHMKVWKNISYPLKVRNVPKDERYDEAKRAAAVVQVEDLLDKYPGELSGGQRQRAALARTLTQSPRAFLMDEPLSDLDAKLKVEIRKEIQQVHKQVQKPTVYVTHDQEEAMTMSDRVAVMNDGEIVQVGTPDELYERPETKFVAKFIGNPTMNFISASIESVDDDTCLIRIGEDEIRFEVGYYHEEPTDSEATVGFRPEGLLVTEDPDQADLTGDIRLLERIGDRKLAHVDTPEGEIRVTIPANTALREGERAYLRMERGKLFIFDSSANHLIVRGRWD